MIGGIMNKKVDIKKPIEGLVLYGYRGSISHNMFIPNDEPTSIDDKDLMGIYIDNIDNYFGIPKNRNRGTKEIKYEEYDIVLYEIRKMFNLLIKNNPNVLSLLWLRDNFYVSTTEIGQRIIDNREIFSSKESYYSFTGYAYGQLKRMTHMALEGYMGEKRKEIVNKFGYDTKNASHLIRLLRMAMEFLSTGELNVWRKDAPQLLEIKRGEWTLEKIKSEADRLFKLSEEAFLRSKLPVKPDYKRAEKLLINILQEYFERIGENPE